MRWTFIRSLFHTTQSPRRRSRRPDHSLRGFEQLESRRVLAASAAFSSSTGALTVSDSSATANNIAISYTAVGSSTYVLVTDLGSSILAGSVLTSSVKSITVASGGGNDTVNLGAVGSAQFTQLYQSPVVDGGDGNDTIYGSKVADLLYGVGGNDTVLGLEASDYLYGGDGADSLYGEYGSNNAANSGADTLYGEAGDDLLRGDQGADTLSGGAGADQLFGNDDNDTLHGGLDGDTLTGGAGNDTLNGNAGNDTYVFSGSANLGADTIDEGANAGTDTVTFAGLSQGATFIASHSTVQTVASGLLTITLTNTDNFETLIGSAYDDYLGSYLNDTRLEGLGGNDTLEGSSANDVLIGGDGDDYLRGGDGSDWFEGGAGDDMLEGDNDPDTFVFRGSSNLGTDTIFDTDFRYDIVDFSQLGEAVDWDSRSSSDTVNSLLTLIQPWGDKVEEIIGTAFNDTIIGNSLQNVIRGLGGNDQIWGGDDDDTLYGDAGDDTLYGQAGTDTLDGGTGSNTLVQD